MFVVHTNAKASKALTGVGVQTKRLIMHIAYTQLRRERTLPGAEFEAALVDRTLNGRRAEILLKPNIEGLITTD